MKDGRSVHLQHPFHGRPDRYAWFGHSTVPARKTGLSCTIERACRPNSPVALFKENISDTDNKVGWWVQQRALQALNPPFRQIQRGRDDRGAYTTRRREQLAAANGRGFACVGALRVDHEYNRH